MLSHGSKNYPFSDLLRKLAERCYGYSNAFTTYDNTGFEIQTVGAEGFIKCLPIYLDNLFNPLLNESIYITEVHHIDGEGKDGGVVYSEMNGKSNKLLMELNTLLLGENSPFAKYRGGDPKAIREECSLEKIKTYHKKYYRMENMILSVSGIVPHQKVLDVVEEFQNANGFVKKDDFIRTFEKYIPPESTEKTIKRMKIPAEGEHGAVNIRWRGPDIWVELLFSYFIIFHLFREKIFI